VTANADDNEVVTEDVAILHRMGYAQELSRRMRGFSNFSVSFSIICILAGGITSFQAAFCSGGPGSAIIGWFVGSMFALIVSLSMAQISSAYPTAGAIYHWSSILGGRGWGWATAFFNMLGLLFEVASVNVGCYLLFTTLMLGNMFHIDTSSWGFWQQTGCVLLITATQGLLIHAGIKLTTKLLNFSGYLIFFITILLTVALLLSIKHLDVSRLWTFINFSGAPGGNVVPHSDSMWYLFLIGLLLPLYTVTGFDGSAHTSEETLDARRTVPRGIINSVFWSFLFGMFLEIAIVLALPDLKSAAAQGGSVFLNMIGNLAVPLAVKYVLDVGIVLSNFLCAMAALLATSRMIFAFARDGGLPGHKLFRYVSPKYRTPVGGIWLAAGLSVAATLYSPAFAALAAGCAMFIYISYAMAIGAGLLAEGKTWTEFGPFRLGIFSKPLAILTVLGVAVMIYIGLQPPNSILISYSIGLIVLLAVLWFTVARKHFPGPPIGRLAIDQRQTEILSEEAAVHQAA
jgi:amino acid transporter